MVGDPTMKARLPKPARMTNSTKDMVFDIVNYAILSAVLLSVLYPLYYVLIASISNPDLVSGAGVMLLPRDVTFEGYRRILEFSRLWVGYRNTLFYTAAGTLINLALTLTAGYALSRKDLKGRDAFMIFLLVTMLFHGGLIPRYLVVKNLGMVNTRWAMLIPQAVAAWNLIVTRTFFQTTIPQDMLDAAVVDGCGNSRFFVSIVLPLSPAIIAVMALFYGVGHWNAFFDALIFIRNRDLQPLQLVLREILVQNQMELELLDDIQTMVDQQRLVESLKYGIIFVASVPILMLYPFLQKYFVKGVMIGALKG
jgi:putative aldouronate transport system permease protein